MEFSVLGDPHRFCSQNSIPIIWIVNPTTSPARQYVRQDKPFGGLISRRCPARERRHHHHFKFATRCTAVTPNAGLNPGIEARLPNDAPNASVYYHNRKRPGFCLVRMALIGSRRCDVRRYPLVPEVLMTVGGSCVHSPPVLQRRREARKPQPVRPCVAPRTRTATE